jgi:hypothetical protein
MNKWFLIIALMIAGVAKGQEYIAPIVSTSAEASKIIKQFPSSLYSVTVLDTVDEYIMVIDSTTVPANGTVKLLLPPIHVSANVTTMVTLNVPIRASNGIVVCNSSTGTLTKTIGGNTCIYSVQAK